MDGSEASASVHSWRRQGVIAAVHRSCRYCQAPGIFTSAHHIKTDPDWQKCWVPQGDPKEGLPVGKKCPSCGKSRGPKLVERLGEIWSRTFS